MFEIVFLQLAKEQQAFDIFMQIGEFFQGFQFQMAEFATNLFGKFGF